MAIHVHCPGCETTLVFADALADTIALCEKCSLEFRVPSPYLRAPAADAGRDGPPQPSDKGETSGKSSAQGETRRVRDWGDEKEEEEQKQTQDRRPRRRDQPARGQPASIGFILAIAVCIMVFVLAIGALGLSMMGQRDRVNGVNDDIIVHDFDPPRAMPFDVRDKRPFDEEMRQEQQRREDELRERERALQREEEKLRAQPKTGRKFDVNLDLPPINRAPLKITPAPQTFERETIELGGKITRVCVGGGGRFLIYLVPSKKQIGILDVNERKIVKYLALDDDNAVIAAGLEKLVVAYPGRGRLVRWNLLTFEQEATGFSPFAMPISEMWMGSASQGPIVVAIKARMDGRGEVTRLMHLNAFAQIQGWPQGQREEEPLCEHSDLHGSMDGRHFFMQILNRVQRVKLEPNFVNVRSSDAFPGHRFTYAPDGQFLYGVDDVVSANFEVVHKAPINDQSDPFLPAVHGSYFLRLRARNESKPGRVSFYVAGNYEPIAHLDDVDFGLPFVTELFFADRVHYVPQAKLLVTVASSDDRIHLRRFDPEEALAKGTRDYVLVTSEPTTVAERGGQYRYSMTVKLCKGGAEVVLLDGPVGMSVRDRTELVWDVPQQIADRSCTVSVRVTDAAGASIVHTFRVDVVDR